jgi:hypothetical protein
VQVSGTVLHFHDTQVAAFVYIATGNHHDEGVKTRVVDTLHFSLDSVRVVTLDEGSTVLGTSLPVSLGSV